MGLSYCLLDASDRILDDWSSVTYKRMLVTEYWMNGILKLFNEEKLNLVLNITITNEDNSTSDFNLNIDINKPPADDLFYLWGGMTVFWTAIGAYVLYISSKFTKLRDK